eukprot:CAMPEP_0194193906 /NCGR_PEP_ID=MMETSP0154-20130528/75290_1 /TAXON_ID=1049557 /ORGANISM="Thalassiothrix antarctica, Strain L6-D1" /LENGTH=395 /DNA_ID=CAMNT_0038918283 /DNA_START=105 /DNA_END=1292 /DNA_ORIENTATION=+
MRKIVVVLLSLLVFVQGQQDVMTSSPKEVVDDTKYAHLYDMSDTELEGICTNLGFQLLDNTDPDTGESIPKTHDTYIEAAKQCLTVQEQMEEMLDEHPEIREEYERELEELIASEKTEQDRLLNEKEQLENELGAAANTSAETTTTGSTTTQENSAADDQVDETTTQQQSVSSEEVVEEVDDIPTKVEEEVVVNKNDEDDEDTIMKEVEEVDDIPTKVEEEVVVNKNDEDDEDTIMKEVLDEAEQRKATTVNDGNNNDNNTELTNIPSALPSMEEQWIEIRDALIPVPIQKVLVRLFHTSRALYTTVRTKILPKYVVPMLQKVIPESVQTKWNDQVKPLIQSDIVSKVVQRFKHDGIRLYLLVKKQLGAILLPLFQRIFMAIQGQLQQQQPEGEE